jgi:hypothetical protein
LTLDIEYYIFSRMKPARQNIHPLLERMGRIQRMERGKLCRMSGRPHYNHQTWQEGRNVVRYVPTEQVTALQAAIEGYRLFMQLAQQYAEAIIQRTRRECPQNNPRQKTSTRRKQPPPRHARGRSTKDV